MIAEIGLLENHDGRVKCSHKHCDGRPAKWRFLQAATIPKAPKYSCTVHLGQLTEVIMILAGFVVPQARGRKRAA